MKYDIPRKLSPEETSCIDCPNSVGEKKEHIQQTICFWNFKASRVWKEEISMTNILSAELAECARTQYFVNSDYQLL